MSAPRMDDALTHCGRIRQLVLHHNGGWADSEALTQFRIMTFAASRAASDPECAGLMRSADRYALDLFSVAAHESWATSETTGADFLRLQISRVLDAFRDRILHLCSVSPELNIRRRQGSRSR